MEEILSFREEHVADVAALYLKAVRGQNRRPPQSLLDYFRQMFFQNPWIAPDITPLVYASGGKAVGFLGVIPREMEFRGQPIRAATIPLFMVDREHSKGMAGIRLMRHLFKGTQDLSFNDGVGNEASSIFTAAGARVCRLYSFNWIRVLRLFGAARSVFDRMGPLGKLKGVAALVTKPMDLLLSKMPVEALQSPKSKLSSRPATARELIECIQQARPREALKARYSMPSFEWLISEVGKGARHEGLRLVLAYGGDGVPCGWFIYYASTVHPASVLQIGAHRPTQFPEVLRALFEDAWEQGIPVIKGQSIPNALTTLTEQHCIFRQPYACVVGYARDPEIMSAFQCGDAALSRLDAGSWLHFSTEKWLD